MIEETTAMRDSNSMIAEYGPDQAKPFTMRKKIRSTVYEVTVYFSQTSRETLKDKILRLIRNEVRQ